MSLNLYFDVRAINISWVLSPISAINSVKKTFKNSNISTFPSSPYQYRQPELLTRDWYVDVDVSKYAAYFVVALNHDMSVSSIIDPLKKIENLLANRK